MRLYEIDEQLRKLSEKIIEQEGEMTEEDIEALNNLNLAADSKMKGYGILVRELDADIQQCKDEIARIKERQNRLERKRDWLASSLKNFMLSNDYDKYESVEVNVRIRTSHPLQGAEEALEKGTLPSEFITVKITETPNKVAIKDFIKEGGVLEGIYLGEEENISIK